jgi:membrane protease subunit (stomatin/prohibitin family)
VFEYGNCNTMLIFNQSVTIGNGSMLTVYDHIYMLL